MKKNKPAEYQQKLFKMVLEQDEGVKSRNEKQAVAASVLEDLVNFTKVYSEMEIVMRHERAFIKFLVEDGQVRDEAEGKAAWDRAAHPSSGVKREIDALGRLTLAVPGLKRYVGQSGTGRNKTISNAMNLQSVDDMNHAQRLMQGQTDIADSVFTRAAGGAFRASASYAHMPTPIGDGGGGPIEAMSPEHLLPFILTGAGGAAEDLKRPIPAPAGGESLPAGPPTTKQGQEDAGPQPPQPAQPKVMNVQEFMEAKKDMAACLRRNYVPVIGTDGKSGGMEVAQKLIAEITDLGDEALEEVKQLGAPTFFDTHKALATELRQIDVNGVPKCKMQEWDAMWENLTVKLAEFQESECQFASFVEALKTIKGEIQGKKRKAAANVRYLRDRYVKGLEAGGFSHGLALRVSAIGGHIDGKRDEMAKQAKEEKAKDPQGNTARKEDPIMASDNLAPFIDKEWAAGGRIFTNDTTELGTMLSQYLVELKDKVAEKAKVVETGLKKSRGGMLHVHVKPQVFAELLKVWPRNVSPNANDQLGSPWLLGHVKCTLRSSFYAVPFPGFPVILTGISSQTFVATFPYASLLHAGLTDIGKASDFVEIFEEQSPMEWAVIKPGQSFYVPAGQHIMLTTLADKCLCLATPLMDKALFDATTSDTEKQFIMGYNKTMLEEEKEKKPWNAIQPLFDKL